ncbi:MAG TPA: hypothetical protein VM389_07110 [Phycisphaerae bacterium]|nr:hypothetical protein [Phycisphaerae bacterium]
MIDLGHHEGCAARLEISGTSSLTVGNRFWIGTDTETGSGILDIKDEATVSISATTYLDVFKYGTINHSGGTLELPRTDEQVGIVVGGAYNLTSAGEQDLTSVLDLGSGGLAIGSASGQTSGGTFLQDNPEASVTAGKVYVAYHGSGTYTLKDGTLETGFLGVGGDADGTFTMEGGTLTITGTAANALEVGAYSYDGRFAITGGTCTVAGGVRIGTLNTPPIGTGTLEMGDGTAISIGGSLLFNPSAVFTVGDDPADSATITVTGTGTTTAFNIKSTSSANLSGLARLTLAIGTGTTVGIEVAGEDKGAVAAGWTDNFALDVLQLGTGEAFGCVRLQDNTDNQLSWQGTEALYVNTLKVLPRVALDMNGLHLYFKSGNGNDDGTPKRLYLGDANVDGLVGIADLSALADHYGSTNVGWLEADFNADRLVGIADLVAIADNYGCGSGGGGGESAAPGGGEEEDGGWTIPADLVHLECESLGTPTGYPNLTRYKVKLVVKDGYYENHKVVAQGFDGRFDGPMHQVWMYWAWLVPTPSLKYAQGLTAEQKERDSHILGGDEDHPILTYGAPKEDSDAPGPPGSLEGTGSWLAYSSTEDMAVAFEDRNDWENTVLGEELDLAHIVIPSGEEVTITGKGAWKYWDDDADMWVYGQCTVSLTVPPEE